VLAAEIDERAARVYSANWQLDPVEDVRVLAEDPEQRVPRHAVLAGGFPCQPFSKSGRQLGMAEERGTLCHDIIRILEAHKPPVVFLENVRNIAGPRQRETWMTVVSELRRVGYRVSGTPCVFSPHLLPPEVGGTAQVRERVFILGTYVGSARAQRETDDKPVVANRPQMGWDPRQWLVKKHVLEPSSVHGRFHGYRLDKDEVDWIDSWNWLLARLGPHVALPGFPLWSDTWADSLHIADDLPAWKRGFLRKNRDFYLEHREAIQAWRIAKPQVRDFPPSRRKLEWQAQDSERDLWRLLIQFRPSGIRVKKATYVPALVAMGQTSIFGPERRRLTPAEAAKLQGFPDWFRFDSQVNAVSYRQLGNAVNVGAARYVFTKYVEANSGDIRRAGDGLGAALVDSVACACAMPTVLPDDQRTA
jgi:DNA (cytosine-5)-methyltransferase 1